MGATEYKASLEPLNKAFTLETTIGGLISDLVSLDKDGRKAAVEYIEYLKTKKPAL